VYRTKKLTLSQFFFINKFSHQTNRKPSQQLLVEENCLRVSRVFLDIHDALAQAKTNHPIVIL
jgi:hypothetical protein